MTNENKVIDMDVKFVSFIERDKKGNPGVTLSDGIETKYFGYTGEIDTALSNFSRGELVRATMVAKPFEFRPFAVTSLRATGSINNSLESPDEETE